jgi:hypothetical protein
MPAYDRNVTVLSPHRPQPPYGGDIFVVTAPPTFCPQAPSRGGIGSLLTPAQNVPFVAINLDLAEEFDVVPPKRLTRMV